MAFFAIYPAISGGGGGGGGITSINGDTTAAQVIAAGTGISVVSGGGTTTITNTSPNTFTPGNLTDAGTDGITITGGTNAVNGAGTSIAQHVADSTHNGYLSSTDWSTFNNKQPAGSYITALTGDVTATGPGSVAATIANLAVTNAKIANGTIDLTTKVTGVLPVANGGTNSSTGSLVDNVFEFVNSSDATKQFKFDLSGETTGVVTTLSPLLTASTNLSIRPLVDATGNVIVQNGTSGQIFIGADSSLGGANSGIQYSDATTANRGQIRLGSYVNATSIAGVTTATSRSGTVGVNAAVVAGQDYSKWTAQAGATTAGSLPISGTFAFKANTVNSLTVTSDFHLQLTNLAGTLGDRLYISSEGIVTLSGYSTGILHSDSSGVISSSAVSLTADVTGTLPIANGGTGQVTASAAFGALSPLTTKGDLLGFSTVNARVPVGTNGQVLTADSGAALGVSYTTISTNTNANIRASEGGGTVTLTNSDNKNQVFNLSADETVVLPTTGVLAGDLWTMINKSQFTLTVQASDASVITYVVGGSAQMTALVNTPVANTDWEITDQKGSGTWTPTGTTGTGVTSVTPGVFMFNRVNNVVSFSGVVAYSTTGTGDAIFEFTVPPGCPTTFTLTSDAGGAGAADFGTLAAAQISANTGLNQLQFTGTSPGASSHMATMTGQYQVK